MRLRIPELLKEKGMSGYAVAKASAGRISSTQIYRLIKIRGRAKFLDARLLTALCDVLKVTPDELLEREPVVKKARKAR